MTTRQQRRSRHIPQRTCVVCRRKTDKRQLTRIVRSPEGQVVVDGTGKQAGRGAYLCNRVSCWDEALRGNVLKRALKADLSQDDLAQLVVHRPLQRMGTPCKR